MACQGCIARQRKLTRWLCKNPESRRCKLAQARLERMLAAQKKQEK